VFINNIVLYIGGMNCDLENEIKAKDLSHTFNTHSQFSILSNMFLKQIGFPLQTYCLHPFERIPSFIVTLASKGDKKPISTEFDVVAHHRQVHPNQFNRKGIEDKLNSMLTALLIMFTMHDSGRRLTSLEYERHAKSQCRPSS
jgi:hypothetical protein